MIDFDIKIITVILIPSFRYEVISSVEEFKDSHIKNSRILFIRKYIPEELSLDYNLFLEQVYGSLVISIGKEGSEFLDESSIDTKCDDVDMKVFWKKVLKEFRKNFVKGAWVVNPYNDASHFYKNHYYTPGAQELFYKGRKIKALGWNEYHLTDKLDKK